MDDSCQNQVMFTDLKIAAGRRPMTQSEARITTIISLVFALMMLAVVFEDFTARRLSILFVILFWAPMLMLHEAGHAIVARMLGWRVREIVIGFGRVLWQWQSGDTRITIKRAPVEGYVLPEPLSPSGLRVRSMLIYAAGPGAELMLLALLIAVFGFDTVFNDSDDIALVALQSLAIVILIGAGMSLLPFVSDGAVSDGMGIISSPFMSDEVIELRMASFDLREARKKIDAGDTDEAVALLRSLLNKYPGNYFIELNYVDALSAHGDDEAARQWARNALEHSSMTDELRLAWLRMQAMIELNAAEPSSMVMDLALQKALDLAPQDADLLAMKGASLTLRGQSEAGGNLLADAWRRGPSDDAFVLAWLTIAAHRYGDSETRDYFRGAFGQINRNRALFRRVAAMTGGSTAAATD